MASRYNRYQQGTGIIPTELLTLALNLSLTPTLPRSENSPETRLRGFRVEQEHSEV